MQAGRKALPVLILALTALITGCAPPPPPYANQRFVPNDEVNVVSLVREGLYYFSRSRFPDADFRFRQALYIVPDADNIKFNLAVTLSNANSYGEAEEIFRSLLSKDPESSKVLAGMARMYLLKGEYPQAQAMYERGLGFAVKYKEYERAAKFARSLAVLHFKLGREQEARCYSEYAMNLYPPPPPSDVIYRHGKLLVALGQPKQAHALITSAAAQREVRSDPSLLNVLALAQLEQGNYAEALSLSELAQDVKTTDYSLGNALQLVRFAAKDMKAEAEKAPAPGEDDEEAEQEAAAQRKLLEDTFNGKPLESGMALYWPLRLLEYLEHEQAELEQEEG